MPVVAMRKIKSLLANKPTLRKALKITGLATGTGVGLTGVGIGAHQIGYRRGASKMGDAMATAFAEQNAIENAGIVRRFNEANKVENAQLVRNAYRIGLMKGLQSQPATMAKISELNDVGVDAFFDEIDKVAASKTDIAKKLISALRGLGSKTRTAIGSISKGKKVKSYIPYVAAGGAGYMAGKQNKTVTVHHVKG